MQEKVYLECIKEQFVPAEYSLLLQWSEVLEAKCKGTTLTYLILQTRINRAIESENYGKTWIGLSFIGKKIGSSAPTVIKSLAILEGYHFIIKKRRGHAQTNIYTVLEVPKFSESLLVRKTQKSVEKASEGEEVFTENNTDVLGMYKEKAKKIIISLLEDPIEKWKTKNFLQYYSQKYLLTIGIRCKETFTGKESGQMKMLTEEYGKERAFKGINYILENWQDLGKEGVPNIGFIYGWRDKYIPEAELGAVNIVKKGQYQKAKTKRSTFGLQEE